MTWYAVVNDLCGGWAVSNLDKPLSEHDFRPIGQRVAENAGVVIADMCNRADAHLIASLLNEAGVER